MPEDSDPAPSGPAAYQAGFLERWPSLRHPAVRNLAWLIEAPVLFERNFSGWRGLLAELPEVDARTREWLLRLDQAPDDLVRYLAGLGHTRLGHYAEDLLAFYFAWHGELHARGVQVRERTTLGEFDFLLKYGSGLEHWEFACKFYLQVEPADSLACFVGPGLQDNLALKARKIFDTQLRLGKRAEAAPYLSAPLCAARALLKGWLFYPLRGATLLPELNPAHCRGVWCRLHELANIPGARYAQLTRMRWLAPACFAETQTLTHEQLHEQLANQLPLNNRPVLIVRLDRFQDVWMESERIFVVPEGWNGIG